MKSHAKSMATISLLVAANFACASQAEVPSYTLRDTIVGSMIPQAIVSAPVPFDKTYALLTSEQKAVLNQDYESLGPDDETPFPVRGLRHLIAPLVPQAEKSAATGKLVASVEVDSQGHARTVTVYKSPSPELSQIATAALMQEQYKPAQCKGHPCVMSYVLRLEFLSH